MDSKMERWISESVEHGIFGSRSEAIEFAVTFLKGLVDRFDVTKESLQKKYPDMSLPLDLAFLDDVILKDIDNILDFLKGLMNLREMIP